MQRQKESLHIRRQPRGVMKLLPPEAVQPNPKDTACQCVVFLESGRTSRFALDVGRGEVMCQSDGRVCHSHGLLLWPMIEQALTDSVPQEYDPNSRS